MFKIISDSDDPKILLGAILVYLVTASSILLYSIIKNFNNKK